MKRTLVGAVSLVFAAGAAAGAQRVPSPVQQTASIDIASAFQQRYRAMVEPLVWGRFALGISGEYTTEPNLESYAATYPQLGGCPVTVLCARSVSDIAIPCCDYGYGYYGDGPYRAWSFSLHGRWYPSALSIRGERQSASIFVGEFIGYHQRRTSVGVYYGCPVCAEAPPPVGDSLILFPDTTGISPTDPVPGQTYPAPSFYRQTLKGWEPGVEFGVRVWPMRHVVMDIGGSFRLARLEDYQSGKRPGDVHSNLMVAIGVGW